MIIVFIRGLHYDAINLIVFESTDILIGLNVRVYIMTLRMKRARIFSFDLRQVNQHKVFKVVTSYGESYALDIAGAQFGLDTTPILWNRYFILHVYEVLSSEEVAIAETDVSRFTGETVDPAVFR